MRPASATFSGSSVKLNCCSGAATAQATSTTPGSLLEDLFDLASQFYLPGIVWSVNFGDQRLLNRWAGWNLGYLNGGAGAVGDAREVRTQALGNVMTLRRTIVARSEIDLNVRLIRARGEGSSAGQGH